jgi:hypothetical protein
MEEHMFRGIAELRNEHGKVGVLTELCEDAGMTRLRVIFEPPIILEDTAFIVVSSPSGELFFAAAIDDGPTKVHELHGKSPVGCLGVGTTIQLLRSPGGLLSTLLEVIASGAIHERHH